MIGNCRSTILVVMLWMMAFNSKAQDSILTITQAHYIISSPKFISWPEGAITDSFRIGILKNKPVYEALRQEISNVGKQTIQGYPLTVVLLKDLESAKRMNLIYSDYSDGVSASDLLQAIGKEPVFLLTYAYGFNATMINLILHENVLKYDLNKYNLTKNGLQPNAVLDKFSIEPNEEDWNNMVQNLRTELTHQTDVSEQLEQDNQTLNKEVSDLNKMIDGLEAEIEKRQQELQAISIKVLRQTEEYRRLKKEQEKATRLLEESRAELEEKTRNIAQIEAHLKEKNEAIEASKKELAEVESQMSDALRLLNNQRILSVGIGLVAIVILTLGVWAFRNYRKQKFQAGVIAEQLEIVESQREEILDSINYAKRIQQAILPPLKLVQQHLKESFILYKPKDIVAGDFYWFEVIGDELFFAAADCTGHGVPGAMVSVVCSNALHKTVIELSIREPAQILDRVRELVVQTFEKSEEEVKDGMDITFCRLNMKTNHLAFAGAHNPLYRVTPKADHSEEKAVFNETHILLEYKTDKQPIGKWAFEQPFKQQEILLLKGDVIYLITDGYADQFGGENGKKFMYKPFKKLLLEIHQQSMDQQHRLLDETFESWKGSFAQIDDVCVFGVRM